MFNLEKKFYFLKEVFMYKSFLLAGFACYLAISSSVIAGAPKTKSCDGVIYETKTQTCCEKTVVAKDQCCSGKILQDGQVCCSNKVVATDKCCSNKVLADNKECCEGKVVAKGKCCNGRVLKAKETCPQETVEDRKLSCGSLLKYDPETQKCCNGKDVIGKDEKCPVILVPPTSPNAAERESALHPTEPVVSVEEKTETTTQPISNLTTGNNVIPPPPTDMNAARREEMLNSTLRPIEPVVPVEEKTETTTQPISNLTTGNNVIPPPPTDREEAERNLQPLPQVETTVRNNARVISTNTKLCSGRGYNPDTHECCNGSVVVLGKCIKTTKRPGGAIKQVF